MGQGRDEEIAAKLADVDWGETRRRLVLYAHGRLRWRPLSVAEHVADEAITRLFDTGYAGWDPEKTPEVLRFLGSIVNGIVVNKNRNKVERAEVLVGPDALAEASDGRVNPESDGESPRLDARRFVDRLLERTAPDPLVEAVVLQFAEGNDKPREQAAALGRPIADITNARRRLDGHVFALKKELGMEVSDGAEG